MAENFPRKPTLNNSDPPRHPPMRMALGACRLRVITRPAA